MKKVVLGMILSLLFFGAAEANAVPKYNASCMFNGCGGVADGGDRAIFTFDDRFPGPDDDFEIYQRVNGQTSQLIDYPEGSRGEAELQFVSDDARRAIVQTRDRLTADDTDGNGWDFFAIQDGVPELISWDPADPSSKSLNMDLQLVEASDDGRTIYFWRNDIPAPPGCLHLWKRTETALTPLVDDCDITWIKGLSRDGSSVFYENWDHDVIRIKNDMTQVINTPYVPGPGCSPFNYFGDSSVDGETLLYSTNQQALPVDTDLAFDLYLRNPDGSLRLITDTEVGATDDCWNHETRGVGLSTDTSRALFVTELPLVEEDQDQSLDIYLNTSEGNRLISTGPADSGEEARIPARAHPQAGRPESWYRVDGSDDLQVIAFDTEQALVPEDTDEQIDVYAWIDESIRLISTGPDFTGESRKAKLIGISNDGSTISFSTPDPLLSVDTDDRMDIYAYRTSGLFRPGDATASSGASASARARTKRVVLVSAESDAPRMKLVGKPKVSGKRAALKLKCPKTEKTGPCRGEAWISFRGQKAKGSSHFRIKTGKTRRVVVKLNRAARPGKASVKIKARDRLGNISKQTRLIRFR